jgi:hypothetical protein
MPTWMSAGATIFGAESLLAASGSAASDREWYSGQLSFLRAHRYGPPPRAAWNMG